MDEITALNRIPEDKPVRIYLPVKNNSQRYRTQAIFKTLSPPRFELHFQPGSLPLQNIDIDKSCFLNVDFGGPNISMKASITSASPQTLKMKAEKLVSHKQMREFFRVDAVTDIISKSFHPEFFASQGQFWALRGKTIDISGNGILATFSEKPPEGDVVRLEISLPCEETELVNLLATPIRTTQVEKNQWEIAYEFRDISSEDRDRIIGCCLEIQRRLLRFKVEKKP